MDVDLNAVEVAAVAPAITWVLASAVLLARRRWGAAAVATGVAAAQGVAAFWTPGVPLALAAWLTAGLALPTGVLRSWQRRAITAAAVLTGVGMTIGLEVDNSRLKASTVVLLAVAVGAIAGGGLAVAARRSSAESRRGAAWIGAGLLVGGALAAAVVTVYVLLETPERPTVWALAALALIPLGVLPGVLPGTLERAERALLQAVAGTTLLGFAVATYALAVLLGLGRRPEESQHDLVIATISATVIVAVFGTGVRASVRERVREWIGGRPDASEMLTGFGTRMSRALPIEELMLQTAESLRTALGPAGAEIWVFADEALTRTVSVPSRSTRTVILAPRERDVLTRTPVAGAGWLELWLPTLLDADPAAPGGESANGSGPALGPGLVRLAPAVHTGTLLGLLVVHRSAADRPFSAEDERALIQAARQVGQALNHVKLDSALQASMRELSLRNEELQASRLRIVTAADASRREIERNLHDGAQQHLVALSVKLGLAQQILAASPEAGELLLELRADAQEAVNTLRELAHGIYPPLLRTSGLGCALASMARRMPTPAVVDVDLTDRYSEQVESAVYFCALEAMQNAGKHAGVDATVTVEVHAADGVLHFAVTDDGPGFDPAPEAAGSGAGFVNMADRLGAVGGQLQVTSAPGHGTTIAGRIPATPLGN